MVTVISYDRRESEEGKEFFTLTVQGGLEVVQSKNGNNYMTAKRLSIPSTFDEQACKLIVGKELPGQIIKLACDPYDYVNKQTGEMITLHHTYEYVDEEEIQDTYADIMSGFGKHDRFDSKDLKIKPQEFALSS